MHAIQILTRNRSIQDFRDHQLEAARLVPKDVWIAARDKQNSIKHTSFRRTKSDGQIPEHETPTNGTSRTPPQRNNSKGCLSQSVNPSEKQTRSLQAQAAKNGIHGHSPSHLKLTAGTRTKMAEDKVQQASKPDASGQEGVFASVLQHIEDSPKVDKMRERERELEKIEIIRRRAARDNSSSEGIQLPISGAMSSSTSSTMRFSLRRPSQGCAHNHTSKPRQSMAPDPRRHRSLQSSHQSNNSAAEQSGYATSHTSTQASKQVHTPRRHSDVKIKAESIGSDNSDGGMFFSYANCHEQHVSESDGQHVYHERSKHRSSVESILGSG